MVLINFVGDANKLHLSNNIEVIKTTTVNTNLLHINSTKQQIHQTITTFNTTHLDITCDMGI